jgi:hypothetical protein
VPFESFVAGRAYERRPHVDEEACYITSSHHTKSSIDQPPSRYARLPGACPTRRRMHTPPILSLQYLERSSRKARSSDCAEASQAVSEQTAEGACLSIRAVCTVCMR